MIFPMKELSAEAKPVLFSLANLTCISSVLQITANNTNRENTIKGALC